MCRLPAGWVPNREQSLKPYFYNLNQGDKNCNVNVSILLYEVNWLFIQNTYMYVQCTCNSTKKLITSKAQVIVQLCSIDWLIWLIGLFCHKPIMFVESFLAPHFSFLYVRNWPNRIPYHNSIKKKFLHQHQSRIHLNFNIGRGPRNRQDDLHLTTINNSRRLLPLYLHSVRHWSAQKYAMISFGHTISVFGSNQGVIPNVLCLAQTKQ